MLTRIEAYHYRCFADLSVDLDDFHVLAGANGAGKSTLLDIPVLLGDFFARRSVIDCFLEKIDGRPARTQSFNDILHCGRGTEFGLAVEAKLPEEIRTIVAESTRDPRLPLPTHLRYEVYLEVLDGGRSLRIAREYLISFNEEEPVRPVPEELADADPDAVLKGKNQYVPRRRAWQRSWRPIVARTSSAAVRFTPETSERVRQSVLQAPVDESAISSVPFDRELYPAALWFTDLLRDGVVPYRPDWAVLRQPAPPQRTVAGETMPKLRWDGQNLPWLAVRLRDSDPDWYDAWVDHVRNVLPFIETIEAHIREEDYHAYFRISYAAGYVVTSSGLSDGTLRAMALTLPAYLNTPPALLVIEEPEDGIYPKGIDSVLDALQAVPGSQVLVATQSPLVVARVGPAKVLAVRAGPDGASTVVRGDEHPSIVHWHGEVDLGTLFAGGIFE